MATMSEKPANVFGPTLSRRQFVKAGGALVVGFSLIGPEILKGDTAKPATFKNSLDPTLPSSWIEIHPDNTVLIRTGKSDFGQGITAGTLDDPSLYKPQHEIWTSDAQQWDAMDPKLPKFEKYAPRE